MKLKEVIRKRMLNEAKLMSLRNQFWKNSTPYDIFSVLQYSANWTSSSDVGSITLDITDNQYAKLEDFEKNNNTISKYAFTFSLVQAASEQTPSNLVIRLPVDSAQTIETELKKKLQELPNFESLKYVFDLKQRPLIDKSSKDKEPVPGKTIVVAAIAKMQGAKADIDSAYQLVQDYINSSGNNKIQTILQHPNEYVQKDGIKRVILHGKFKIIHEIMMMLENNSYGETVFSPLLVTHLNYSLQNALSSPDKTFFAENDIQKSLQKLCANKTGFEFDTDIDNEQRWLLNLGTKSIGNKMYDGTEIKTMNDFGVFVGKIGLSSKIHVFNILKKADNDTINVAIGLAKKKAKEDGLSKAEEEAFVKAETIKARQHAKIQKNLVDLGSIEELRTIINDKDDAENEKKKKKTIPVAEPTFGPTDETTGNPTTNGGKCAQRRMKLFDAAKHYGAEIIKTNDWMAAICKNAKQVAAFGRLKPKVKPGTNEIDPACNLEDWEGITPENKAKRDDKTGKYPCIQDNIDDEHGHSFNQLHGEASQSQNGGIKYAESGWCVSGAPSGMFEWGASGSSSLFNNYTESGKRPLVVFMDTKRGALYLYAKFVKYGSVIENFLNENEKCDGDSPTGSDPSDDRQMAFISTFKSTHQSFKTVVEAIGAKYYADLESEIDIDEEEPNFGPIDETTGKPTTNGGKCAQRRMKLFEAARHFGAEIIKTSDWVVAVLKQGNQAHPFCRLKPKVKPGTNEIDPACNLEDWEGITPENKAKRDDKTGKYPCIQDNIDDEHGYSFNNLKSRSGQKAGIAYAESAWCVCGAFHGVFEWGEHSDSFFSSYASASKPMLCFMDTKRGALYLYSNLGGDEQFGNEQDTFDGNKTNTANCTSEQLKWLYDKFIPSKPSFANLLNALKAKYFKKSSSSSTFQTPEKIYQQAKSSGLITPNNWLIIKSKDNAKQYQQIFDKVNGIRIECSNTTNMFAGMNLTKINKIDFCNTVVDAHQMFYTATLGEITLINTSSVQRMSSMFKEAIIEKVEGLDTSSAVTIENIFYKTKTMKNAPLQFTFTFNLQNCSIADHAFYSTNIRNVNLSNVQNITSAIDMYANCRLLSMYPETKFPKISNIKRLTQNGSSIIDMFKGCATLQSKERRMRLNNNADFDFYAAIEDTEKYYSTHKNDDLRLDERNFILIHDLNEYEKFQNDIMKYPGIVIDNDNASSMFENRIIKAKVIDLQHVVNASRMFYSADFAMIDSIINTENIEEATSMFRYAKIEILPKMTFKKLKKFESMLHINGLVELPEIEFPSNVSISNKLTVPYVFGDTSSINDTVDNISLARIETWISNAQKQAVSTLKDNIDEAGVYVIKNDAELDIVLSYMNINKNNHGIKTLQLDYDTTENVGFRNNKKYPELVLPVIDVSKIKTLKYLFNDSRFKGITGIIGTEKHEQMPYMFRYAQIANGIPDFDTSNIVDASHAFERCECKTTSSFKPVFPKAVYLNDLYNTSHKMLPDEVDFKSLFKIDSAQNISGICVGVSSNIIIKDVKLPKCLIADSAFESSYVSQVISLDMPAATSTAEMFKFCGALTTVGIISAPQTMSCRSMFSSCSELKTVFKLDIMNCTRTSYMFNNCTELKTIMMPTGFSRKVFDAAKMFYNCPVKKIFGVSGELLFTMLKAMDAANSK